MSSLFGKAKKIAKDIWKVAKGVTGSIAGKEGIIAKAYGKIKSFGSMALGMVFPGMGSDELSSYQSITSSAKEAGGTTFVENYGKALSSAASKSATVQQTGITGRIRGAFDWMGAKIENGAEAIYDRTLEFMGQGDKKKITDSGDFIATKAKETVTVTPYKNLPSVQATQALKAKTSSVTGFLTSSEAFDPTSTRGISELIGRPQAGLKLLNQPLNVQYEEALKAGMDTDVINQSRDLGISPFSGIADKIKTKGIIASGVSAEDLKKARGIPPIILDETYRAPTDIAKKPGLLDRAVNTIKENKTGLLEGLASGLGAFAADDSLGITPTRGVTPSQVGTQRGGLGGEGSAGGAFLSEAQRSFFDKYNKQLSQVG